MSILKTGLTNVSSLNTKISGLNGLNSGKSLSDFLNKPKHKITVHQPTGGAPKEYELPTAKTENTKIELGVLVCDFLKTMIGGEPVVTRLFNMEASKLRNLPNDPDYKTNVNSAREQGKRYITYDIAILDTTRNPLKGDNGEPLGYILNEVVIAGLASTSNWMIDAVNNFSLMVDPYTISSIHMVPKSTTQAR